MNAFLKALESNGISEREYLLKRIGLTTLQVNMGNLCNQYCEHCHVDASPGGNKIMSKKVIDSILKFLSKNFGLILDITGGTPELNPNFDYFIIKARPLAKEIIVRSNLTVLFESGKEYLPEFFKKYNIHLICSLPYYEEEDVDTQRGKGVFNKSIEALRLLNEQGYAKLENLNLDLAYNPQGANLPPKQDMLEGEYKSNLREKYGVEFNRLISITNVPVKRFKKYLDSKGEYNKYLEILKDNFNPDAVEKIMCREFLSVGYDGRLYDCDFNQSLGWALRDKDGSFLIIDKIALKNLEHRDILNGEHCLSCTVGYGSSCQGALVSAGSISSNKEAVKEYYGKILRGTKDLKTSACCTIDSILPHHRDILNKIHLDIINRFYGCGFPIPPVLKDCTVLDLGCGTGRDVYIVSALVGSNGFVIGVDMTNEQLEVARKYINYHMEKFSFPRPNVEFRKGYIENLKDIGIEDDSVDVVISNCVINLSLDKKSVFSEIFRVLKPGGEIYFSDVFTRSRMPKHLKLDLILYGECLGGALYIEDFRRILRKVGCLDYRVVSKRKITLNNPDIEAKVGMIDFYSMTIRAFKLNSLEDICEDYGQVATYLGTIPKNPHQFIFDDHHIFKTGKPELICGNTASMLQETRYSKHFNIMGDRSVHYGPFPCGSVSDNTKDITSFRDSCCY
jgi:radical SAM/Cys-rich protein